MGTTTTMTSPSSNTRKIFNNRNFVLTWIGQIISTAGDYTFDTTLILWITTVIARGQPWAPLAVGGVLLAAALPVFVVGPIAGVFVDRWNKRLTMIRMDFARTALILALLLATGMWNAPFVAAAHVSSLWLLGILYIVVFLTSACAQFFNPSLLVFIKEIVDEPEIARATGLAQFSGNLTMVIGPSLATLLFFRLGVQWLFLFNALSFLVSFLSILMARISPPAETEGAEQEQQGNFIQQFGEGVRFYIHNRVLMTILVAGGAGMLFIGTSNALGIFFVIRNLHASPALYGFMATTFGVGLTAGAILASLFAQRVGLVRMFWISLVL
ncbi:MAG TPA: MFS transporter, partial [Ktedonobacteraceae bacterium]